MENEIELVKPRFQVIGDYPNNPYGTVGSIINDNQIINITFFRLYPNLFKELKWWENREIKEMPKYLSIGSTKFVEVKRWIWQVSSYYAIVDYDEREGYDMEFSSQFDYLPATEKEYLSNF